MQAEDRVCRRWALCLPHEDQAVWWALLPGKQCLQSEPYILRRASGDGGQVASGRPPISRQPQVPSSRAPRCWVGQD